MARWCVFSPGNAGNSDGWDVDQAARVAFDEARRQDAHEASQHHQRRGVRLDGVRQRCIEGLAAREVLVRDGRGGDAMLARETQAGGVGSVAQYRGDSHTEAFGPTPLFGRTHDGRHVGAFAGNQDDDVLHGRRDYPCAAVRPWLAGMSQRRHLPGARPC